MPDMLSKLPPETRRLLPLGQPQPLAIAASFPLHLAALEGRLYAAWADPVGTEAWLAVLDESGAPQGFPHSLPLSYLEDLGSSHGSLWLVAARPGDDQPRLLELDGQGTIRWENPIPVGADLARWPRLACHEDSFSLYWESGGEHPAVCRVRLDNNTWQQVVRVEIDSPSTELNGTGDGPRLVLGRTSSSVEGLQLIAIQEAGPTRQAFLPGVRYPEHISLVASEGQIGGLWLSMPERSLQIQWFNEELIPLAPAQPLALAEPGGQVSTARFISSGEGHLAVYVQTEAPGDAPLAAEGTAYAGRPALHLAQFVGPLSWKTGQGGPFFSIQPAGSSFFTGAWITDRLAVVHGDRQPWVSFFTAELEVPV